MSIKSLFQNIATAIKTKDSSILSLTPAEMPQAIIDLPSGATIDMEHITIVGLYATKRRGGGSTGYCQFADIELLDSSDNVLQFSTLGNRCAAEWGGFATGSGEFATNAFDNNVNTKAILNMTGGTNIFSWFSYFPNGSIDCTTYNKWRWYTANDSADRDPVSFGILLGSGDPVNGFITKLFDFQNEYNVTTNRKSVAYTGNII